MNFNKRKTTKAMKFAPPCCTSIMKQRKFGIVFYLSEIFCFTYFLSGFLFRVRGRVGVRDGVGDGFRVRVRDRASVRAR